MLSPKYMIQTRFANNFSQDVGIWENSTLQEAAQDVCTNAVLNDVEVADCIANVAGFGNATVEHEIRGCVEDIRVSLSFLYYILSLMQYDIVRSIMGSNRTEMTSGQWMSPNN